MIGRQVCFLHFQPSVTSCRRGGGGLHWEGPLERNWNTAVRKHLQIQELLMLQSSKIWLSFSDDDNTAPLENLRASK